MAANRSEDGERSEIIVIAIGLVEFSMYRKCSVL